MRMKWLLFLALGFSVSGFAQSTDSGKTFQGLIGIYSPQMEGQKMANGEVYSGNSLTVAHSTLPFGTRIRVTNFANGKSVVAYVSDRLPSGQGRVLKVSSSIAKALGFLKEGVAYAQVDVLGQSTKLSSSFDPSGKPPKVVAQMTDSQMAAEIKPQDFSDDDPVVALPAPKRNVTDDVERDTRPVRTVNPDKVDVKPDTVQPLNVNRIFVIQFGAFSTQAKAKNFVSDLSKRGISAYYVKEGKASSQLFKVRESKIYRDLQEVFAKVVSYKKQGLDCFAVGKFFVAGE